MGRWFNFHIPRADAAGMVETMDMLSVRCGIVSAHPGIGPDFRLGNFIAREAARQYPGRFFCYVAVNPNYPRHEIEEELERLLSDEVFVGIKMHPDMHQHPADGPGYEPAWEAASARRCPVLCHTWDGSSHDSPQKLVETAERFPNVPVILGHCGGSIRGMEASIEAVRTQSGRPQNIYLDLTGSALWTGRIERMVEKAGAERILFGTDLPFIDPRPQLGSVLMAGIGDEQKRMILGLNAARLFGLEDKFKQWSVSGTRWKGGTPKK
jgi:hypothetical protein